MFSQWKCDNVDSSCMIFDTVDFKLSYNFLCSRAVIFIF